MRVTAPDAGHIAAALSALAGADRGRALATLNDAISRRVQLGDLAGATDVLRSALARAPREPALLARAAGIAKLAGDERGALEAALAALALDPGDAFAAAIAVDLLAERGVCGQAVAIGEACLARTPDAPHVQRALGQALLMRGSATAALRHARAAATALPGNLSAVSGACVASLYDETITPVLRLEAHRRLAAQIAPPPGTAPFPASSISPADSGRRLRIGFLSADLRAHPVGFFMESLLRALDRERFEPVCYARQVSADAVTQRLRGLPLTWRDTSALDDAQTLALIRADAPHVLIDLSGHTHGGRPRVIAARAAPLQIGYLGYPWGSGIPNLDLTLGDAIVFPAQAEANYPEALARLPGCFLCLAPDPQAPPVSALPHGADAPFTFASFNHLAKLSDATVELWSRVLAAVPGSRLALAAIALSEAATRQHTAQRFAAHGIDPARLVLLPPRVPLAQFLRYYDGVDLALDPLPFNGGTTTVQALWQGVPTITLPGQDQMNRMGLSILTEAGLAADFAARDADDYVQRAVAWSQRPQDLAALRAGLRDRLSGTRLIDADRFARGFEGCLLDALAARSGNS